MDVECIDVHDELGMSVIAQEGRSEILQEEQSSSVSEERPGPSGPTNVRPRRRLPDLK